MSNASEEVTEQSTIGHTPGPWRWEVNQKTKHVNLCGGGGRQYDLSVLSFERWGCNGAQPCFLDHSDHNLRFKLSEKPEWIVPFPGREHHANWCSGLNHPDANLIASAPQLLTTLEDIAAWLTAPDLSPQAIAHFQNQARAAIAAAKGGSK